jgi:hypothetical protein
MNNVGLSLGRALAKKNKNAGLQMQGLCLFLLLVARCNKNATYGSHQTNRDNRSRHCINGTCGLGTRSQNNERKLKRRRSSGFFHD